MQNAYADTNQHLQVNDSDQQVYDARLLVFEP